LSIFAQLPGCARLEMLPSLLFVQQHYEGGQARRKLVVVKVEQRDPNDA